MLRKLCWCMAGVMPWCLLRIAWRLPASIGGRCICSMAITDSTMLCQKLSLCLRSFWRELCRPALLRNQLRERSAVAAAPLATISAMPAQPIAGMLSPNSMRLSRAANTMPEYCKLATTSVLRLFSAEA